MYPGHHGQTVRLSFKGEGESCQALIPGTGAGANEVDETHALAGPVTTRLCAQLELFSR